MKNLQVEIFGASHEPSVGVRMTGIPVGSHIDMEAVNDMLRRRGASSSPWSTPRKEADEVVFTAGVEDGVVTGDIEAVIYNRNTRPQDYSNALVVPRPSHADYVSYVKYGKIYTGGGKWSGRLTAPLCIAGAIAKDILEKEGIKLGAYVESIGNVKGKSYKDGVITYEDVVLCHKEALPTLSNATAMTEEVIKAKQDLDSVGGTIECIVWGLPVGLGDNLFDGMESEIAYMVYGVPGVKGVEFGSGFDISKMRGSEANDPFILKEGKVITATNNSGGINGGITNGMPLTLRVAMRPTPSISKEQSSVDLSTMEPATISVKGRHDACIVPRAVAAIESAISIAILNKLLENKE